MRKSEDRQSRRLGSESGQALIEYVLLIAITISLVTIMATGLRKSVFTLWTFYTKAIAAPCPGCPAPTEIR